MGEQTKNMLIGLFVIVACFLVISMVFFLRPEVGDGRQKVYARFANINKIDIGTRVMFAGKPVGEVVAIEEIHDARQMPSTDLLGRVYFYQLTLRIDSQVKIYDTDEMSIQTSGLLGEKSIAITPKAPPKGVIPTLVTNQPVYAESADPIENAFLELSDLANDMQATVKDAHRWIQKHGEELGAAVRSFSEIAQGLAKGEGTLGRLLEQDDLYLRMNTLMSDLNNYGLLFHLNKSWQRQHLQKAEASEEKN